MRSFFSSTKNVSSQEEDRSIPSPYVVFLYNLVLSYILNYDTLEYKFNYIPCPLENLKQVSEYLCVYIYSDYLQNDFILTFMGVTKNNYMGIYASSRKI